MFNKKPWSDALFPDFDDSFESRFYCFGGDGGGNKGGGGTPPPKENVYNPENQEPERGRPTTTAPPPQKAEVYTGPFTSQIAEDIYKSGPERPPIDVQKDFGVASIAPQAVVGVDDAINKRRVDDSILASFPPDKNVMSSGLQRASESIFSENLLGEDRPKVDFQDVYERAKDTQKTTKQGLDFSPTGTLKNPGVEMTYTTPLQDLGLGNLLNKISYSQTPSTPSSSITEEQRSDIFRERFDRNKLTDAQIDKLINQKRLKDYFDSQSDVGVFTPPGSDPSFRTGYFLGPDIKTPEEFLREGSGGFADPLIPNKIQNFIFSQPAQIGLAQGGIVSLLEPLGDYLGNQIDQQRVDPFLEMVENAAYQEFGIDPSSGGGGMGSVGFEQPELLPGQMEPQVGGFESLEMQPGKYISDNELTVSTGFLGRPALGFYPTATTGQEQMTNLLGAGPNIGNETVQPDFMQSALGYFGETYDTFNADTGMSSTAMTPELMVQRAQSRLMQQDLKPKAETDYLNNIIQTGGNPTMMAPDMSGNMQQLNLLEVGPGGGVSSGQALPSTNPYQAQLQSAFGGIGSLF